MSPVPDNHIAIKNIGFSLLEEGKTLRVKADGFSMYPAVKPGSILLIESLTEGTSPSPGEIIAWKRDTGFVVHRLIRIVREDSRIIFITRGDSCAVEDHPVFIENIAGRVVRVETESGRILLSGDQLIIKPAYLYNRLLVWVLVRIRRVFGETKSGN